jgi:anti-anti-sigma factor
VSGALRLSVADQDPAYTVVTVDGELTRRTGAQLRRAIDVLVRGGSPRVVLDIAELRRADDAGLHALSRAHRAAAAAGVAVVLADPQPLIECAILSADLTDDLPCYDNVDDAGRGDPGDLHTFWP